MSTNFTSLKTHWTPEDAHAVLSLLDELRDALWSTYGHQIIRHYQQQQTDIGRVSEEQLDLFHFIEDEIPPF